MAHTTSVLRRFLSATRDLFFPPRCAVCGELLPPFAHESGDASVFCPACRAVWDEARLNAAEAAAASTVAGHAYLVHYRGGQTDGVPERFIFHLKHQGDPRAFAYAARALTLGVGVAVASAEGEAALRAMPAMPAMPETLTAEVAAPVQEGSTPPILYTYPPRRRAAVRTDGFDQAERLTRALAREMDGEFVRLLRRTRRPAAEQKTLHADERTANATHAYVLRQDAADRVRGRTVVLCDDLATTGATLRACAQLLTDAGAAAVVLATVGQTIQ